MNKVLHTTVMGFGLMLLLGSCGAQLAYEKSFVKKELSISELLKRNFVPPRLDYKSNYFNVVPYLYYNISRDWNANDGDFYNIQYNSLENYNMLVDFEKKLGPHKNVLVVMIRDANNSVIPIKNRTVKASSKFHGDLKVSVQPNSIKGKNYTQVLLTSSINYENHSELLQKLRGDQITLTVDDKNYRFVSAELPQSHYP